MASRILIHPGLQLRGAQQIRMQMPCRLQPRRYLSQSLRLQLAAKRNPTRPFPLTPSTTSATPRASNTKPRSSGGAKKHEGQTLDEMWRQRRVPLIGAGALVFCMSLYVSLIVAKLYKSAGPACAHEHAVPSGLPEALTSTLVKTQDPEEIRQTAENFDRDLDFPERVTGTRKLRRKLAHRARGHVLEVSIGTGRNLGFYDWRDLIASYASDPDALARRRREHFEDLLEVDRWEGNEKKFRADPEKQAIGSLPGEILSFTGLDISPDMLGIARTRIRDSVPGLDQIMYKRRREPMPREVEGGEAVIVDLLDSRVRLFMGDAQDSLPPPAPLSLHPLLTASSPPTKYDTILQTFGLCSVADPLKLLSNMAGAVKPDSGRIILLEHGRGWYDWINTKLDQFALPHFQRYGCWWNRDIEGLVREAARQIPGLEVVAVDRPKMTHFGTTLVIELRMRSDGVVEEKTVEGGKEVASEGKSSRGWW